jgi:uncharacterized membrane protein (DUF373 family)
MMLKINFLAVFNKVLIGIFILMMIVIITVLLIGVVDLFIDIRDLVIEHEIRSGYLEIIYDVLTLFVMIELLRSLAEYFNSKRLRMTFITDAAIVFVLREVMIKLFEEKIDPGQLYGMSALIIALTILRVGSVLLYQRDAALAQKTGK